MLQQNVTNHTEAKFLDFKRKEITNYLFHSR